MLTVRVARTGAETLAGRLALLAEDAAFAKSHAQRVADAVAGVFVPVVIAIAGATLLISLATGVGLAGAVERAVAVLVVSCPCALGLATPLAVANAIGAGARRGLLVRGGPALERAGAIVTVAFDKTGTLTEGRPEVVGFVPRELAAERRRRHARAGGSARGGRPAPGGGRDRARGADRAHRPPSGLSRRDVERRPGAGLVGRVDGVRVVVGNERLLTAEGVTVPAAARG